MTPGMLTAQNANNKEKEKTHLLKNKTISDFLTLSEIQENSKQSAELGILVNRKIMLKSSSK